MYHLASVAVSDTKPCTVPDLRVSMQLRNKHAVLVFGSFAVARRTRIRPLPSPRLLPGIRRGLTATQSNSDSSTPLDASDVRQYAQKQFQAEVDISKPDAHINLAKACMLIALEEEAAIEDHILHSSSDELAWLKVLSSDVQQQNELEDVELSLVNRDIGTASSWSLSRLDALADEVKTCFLAQHTSPSGTLDASASSTESVSEDDTLDRQASVISTNSASDEAALLDRKASISSASSSTEPPQDTSTMQLWQSWVAWAVSRLGGAKHRTAHRKEQCTEDMPPTLDPVVIAMQQYPMQTVAAINTVLYEQHGYNRMHLHGNPRDAQLSSVLESGAGTPAALAVLYMEVARRLGTPMAALPLEGGRQCMVWPEHGGLSAHGEDFVIDPYSRGALYSQAEVAELFDLDIPQTGLQPATKRETLAAMLAAVRDSYWCKAVGCHPEPALMTPINVQVAASGKVQPMDGFDIKRALAAAKARVVLLPGAREVQLEHALLLYFSGQHADALQVLEQYKDCMGNVGEHIELLSRKLSYINFENTNW